MDAAGVEAFDIPSGCAGKDDRWPPNCSRYLRDAVSLAAAVRPPFRARRHTDPAAAASHPRLTRTRRKAMRKLRLNTDELAIEPFEVEPAKADQGTVLGNDFTGPACPTNPAYSCN